MKSKLFLILLAVTLMVNVTSANIITNGDFEADAGLVPLAGDTDPGPPAGWEYDRYYGYDVDPWLMKCSAVGDGSGGDVGVVLGTWNADGAWDPVIAQYMGTVAPGSYTLEVTTAALSAVGGGWLDVQLGWRADPDWNDYAEYVREWIDVSADFGSDTWTTLKYDFVVASDDPGVGNEWYIWLRGQSYDDHVVVGSAVLVPEPATLALLGLGTLMLKRKRS
ncbi:MAG: PEP-CTERM sorting domain-containing protein [Planctomycetota bacterium]